MKLSGVTFVMVMILPATSAIHAANPGAPVDYLQRNEKFAPAPTVNPAVRTPETVQSLQARRVDQPVVEKNSTGASDQRAALELAESQPKTVRQFDAHSPAAAPMTMSTLNHRPSAIEPKASLKSPPLVSKYQDGMKNAATLTPAPVFKKRVTSGGLNRFVPHKGAGESTDIPVVTVSDGKMPQH